MEVHPENVSVMQHAVPRPCAARQVFYRYIIIFHEINIDFELQQKYLFLVKIGGTGKS